MYDFIDGCILLTTTPVHSFISQVTVTKISLILFILSIYMYYHPYIKYVYWTVGLSTMALLANKISYTQYIRRL